MLAKDETPTARSLVVVGALLAAMVVAASVFWWGYEQEANQERFTCVSTFDEPGYVCED